MNKPYHMKVRVYPHHALRENKMLTGAGADRMQTGMQKAFGRIIGTAAQVKEGAPIFTVYADSSDIEAVSTALLKARPRLPCRCAIKIVKKP